MEIKIIQSIEEFQKLESSWNPLLERSGNNSIFLTYEWFHAYLKTIAAFKKLATIVAKESGRVVGIAPLMLQKREGFTNLYVIGHEVLDYEDFIVDVDYRDKSLTAIFGAIMALPGWSLFQINKVREDSPNLAGFREFAGRIRASVSEFSVAPYLPVNSDFEPYWSSLKKSFRNDIKRRYKRMTESWGTPQFIKSNNPAGHAQLFETLTDFHIRRRKHNKGDYSFLERPERRAFYRAIIEGTAKNGWLHLSELKIDERTIAIHLGFKYGRRYYYYLPTFDEDFEKYSVGYHLLKMLLQECFNDSCDEFDMLLGDEPYKFRLNATKRMLYSFSFFPKRMSGRIAWFWWNGLRKQLRNHKYGMKLLPLLYKMKLLKTNT